MSFALLMGTFVVGIAAMLGIIGTRQWQMGYRIAGGLSLIVAVVIIIVSAWVFLTLL